LSSLAATVLVVKSTLQAQQVTTQETDALAILGYAANVLRVKNCPSEAGEN